MPTYEIALSDGRVVEIDANREPTMEEAVAAVRNAGIELGAPAPEKPEPTLAEKATTFGIGAAGGTVAGMVGAIPGPITTPAAFVIGAGTEALRQGVEMYQGHRELGDFSLGSIAAEGGISAVPLGAGGVLRQAAKMGAVEAVGAQARSLIDTGEFASAQDTAMAAGLGAVGGGGGAAVEGALRARAARAAQRQAQEGVGRMAGGVSEAAAERGRMPTTQPELPLVDVPPQGELFPAAPPRQPSAQGPDVPAPERAFTVVDKRQAFPAGTQPELPMNRGWEQGQLPVTLAPRGAKLEDDAVVEGVRAAGPRAKRVKVVQVGLFDDAGRVRPSAAQNARLADAGVPPPREGGGAGPTPSKPGTPDPAGQPRVVGASDWATGETVDAVRREGAEAIELLAATPAGKSRKRLFLQVADLWKQGDLDAPGLLAALDRDGLSITEWVDQYYVPSISRAGRELRQLRNLSVELEQYAAQRADVAEAVEKLTQAGKVNRLWDFLQKLDDTRRGLLISQVKTGVRNFVTQANAAAGDLLESAMTGGRQGFRDQLDAILMAARDRKANDYFDRMLRVRSDLRQKMGTTDFKAAGFIDEVPVLRATIGRFTEATTAVNRWQEMFFRQAKFDAVLRQRLRGAGLDVAEHMADPKLIPDDMLEDATEQALLLTFQSANPAGLAKIVNGAQLVRPISTFLTPFPRYMLNAATYFAKHNPLGLTRLLTKGGRENAGTVMAEAAVGTMYLGAAYALRASEAAGEKWYEVQHGDKRIDLRGFAGPFAPYLFLADVLHTYQTTGTVEGYSGGDLLEGVLSMNRMAGTAATALTFLNEESPAGWSKGLAKFAGEWWGGFATPARTVKDVLGMAGDEEALTYRDTKSASTLETFTGPIRQSVPGLERELPERLSITTGEPIQAEHPWLSAVLGMNVQTRSPVDAEMNRLGVKPFEVAPRTGVPEADRELYRRVGKLASLVLPKLIASPAYQQADDAQRTVIVKGVFESLRQSGRAHLKATMPRLDAAAQLKRHATEDVKRLAASRGADLDAMVRTLVEDSESEE